MTQVPPEQDAFLNQVVDVICRYGLRSPALLLLEAGRPLALLGGQLLWVVQPALTLFLSGGLVAQAARLLEEPEAVQLLIARLEAKEQP